MLARFPREVMWIQRDAVPTDPWAWVKRHEAKRFCSRRANHFPSVDVQGVTQTRHLVCHANVHRAKCVFQKLRRFGNSRRTYRMNILDDLRIEVCRHSCGVFRNSADHFGNVMSLELWVTGINTFW